MLYGAVLQSLPDIDFVNSFWMDTADDLLAHRGITHSLLFVIVAAIFTGLLLKRIHRALDLSLVFWISFTGIELCTHVFLDAQNNYGTGWFEPFSDYRVSFNTLFVADPLFTIWPLIAFILLLFLNKKHPRRNLIAQAAILFSGIYLLYCVYNKVTIDREVRDELSRQQIPTEKYFTTPTPLNNWLWYVVVADSNGFRTGYRSVFDSDETIQLHYFPKKQQLLNGIKDQHEVNRLKKFSQGYYTVERWGDTLVFNDLRFGQITGWHDPAGKFVFHYFLMQPGANDVVVQRGRFSGWNSETLKTMVERIRGKRKDL
jgi:inner membrane protein